MKWMIALSLSVGLSALGNLPSVEISMEDGSDKNVTCSPQIFGSVPRPGGRCRFSDEVMVGIRSLDPLYVECGRLVISCFGKKSDEKAN